MATREVAGKSVRLSAEAINGHINEGLTTLQQLCEIYDNGRPYIAFSMATEIARILTDNSFSARLRAQQKFTTTPVDIVSENLCSQNKLIVMSIDNRGSAVDFIPQIMYNNYEPKELKFADWWNRDAIWVAGAAKPGLPMDMVPLDPKEQVPFSQRRRLVRRELVLMMRNKLGAHLDAELPEILDELQRVEIFGMGASITTPMGTFNTWDGTLPIRVGPSAAMVRQIGYEVLKAYGRI
ncbi:hypothetical protein [Methylobacterium sp. Leaf399]|uniref:hypothetical protein n=1 Tax=Methylobacterium sp. Leaf399 TaxID=1736364 RepID=UPI000A7C4660|nr:hypothetical protein [Methylobacterium sp. Leaf399]